MFPVRSHSCSFCMCSLAEHEAFKSDLIGSRRCLSSHTQSKNQQQILRKPKEIQNNVSFSSACPDAGCDTCTRVGECKKCFKPLVLQPDGSCQRGCGEGLGEHNGICVGERVLLSACLCVHAADFVCCVFICLCDVCLLDYAPERAW